MKQISSSLIASSKLCHDWHEIRFSWDPEAGQPMPGQFITIRVAATSAPLLRRPFALSDFRAHQNQASVIFHKRGLATQILAAKLPGNELDIIGPLGNSFTGSLGEKQPILIAGGIGLGPMLFLGLSLNRAHKKPKLIFGCRTKEMVPCSPDFQSLDPVVCTDDGSQGFKGTVVDYLRTLDGIVVGRSEVFCCGPHPMLAACHRFAVDNNISCQVSVEQVMACGVGACMGCMVKIVREPGYARACKEGPVFESREMAWV